MFTNQHFYDTINKEYCKCKITRKRYIFVHINETEVSDLAKDIYIRHTISSLINVNKIVTIHYSDFDKDFNYEGESHDFWELLYVVRGRVWLETKHQNMLLHEGEIVFHKPNEFHRHYCDGKTSPRLFIVTFVCHSAAMAVFKGMHTRLPVSAMPALNHFISEAKETFSLPKYDPHMKGLIPAEHTPPGGQQMVKLNLEMLLILLLRESERTVFTSKDAWEQKLADEVTDYLTEHLGSRIRLADICRDTHHCKTLLCNTFKRVTGLSIMEYLNKIRIEKSKELMLSGLSVREAAELSGFDNQYYFSRVFKNTENKTPREFLKEQKNI